MAYRVEAQTNVEEWLRIYGFTHRRTEPISLTNVVEHIRPFRQAIVTQIVERMKEVPGCAIRSDSPQYLCLSPELSVDAETGYAFSKKAEGSGQGFEVFGYRWMIIYYGNAFQIRLFAITNKDSKLAGVEVHAGVTNGKAHDDLIVQMCLAEETQTATEQIQSALQSWILRIYQEMPTNIEHTDDTFK